MANIQNVESSTVISGSSSADSINNWGDKATINALAGNDTIYNDAASVLIDSGAGNDSIINFGGFVTILGVSGNNFFANSPDAEFVTILGGMDADTIYNDAANVSINSGAGNDSIQNAGSKVTIDMAGGNDLIKNFAESVSINGGDNDDTIGNWAGGNYVTIHGGNGNDSIYNNGGSHVAINGDAGNDKITNWNANNSIDGGADDDSIENRASNVTITGDKGNDSIKNYKSDVKIDGGADNDYIYNEGSDSTITGGAGSDTIYNTAVIYKLSSDERQTVSADNVSINGGTGDDSIINSDNINFNLGGGKNVTLNGGAGNDTLTGSKNAEIFIYENGGGFDVITNYSGEDTVKIASGTIESISISDADVIFNVGDGSLTLKNMQGRYITLIDSSGKKTTQIYGDTGYSAQDVIKNLVKAWNKTFLSSNSKLDESIKLSTQYNGIQDAIDHMIADCRAAGDADTFLRKYCGIILDNADTGAITGWDAGGVSIKTANDIVGETLPATKVPDYTNTWFTTSQGVNIHISSTGSSLNADGKKVFDGLYSWWADNSIKLIEDSYGISFSDKDSIDVTMVKTASYAGVTTRDSVKINQGNTSFAGDDDYNGNGRDRTIAHEFTHVAQNLYMGGQFPQFLMEGLADLTHGTDDWGGKNALMPSLAGNADSLATYLDLNNSGTGTSYYYAAGFMFYRYLARQASFSYDSLAANAWEDNISIVGTANTELLTGSGKNQTISADAGNDTITSYGDQTKIIGGKGNDTIYNSGENVVFKYADGDGNDKITGFNETSTLLIDGTFSTAKSGNNVIVTVGNGKISLISAANLSSVNIKAQQSSEEEIPIDIRNTTSNTLLSGTSGNDTIQNGGYWADSGYSYETWHDGGSNNTIYGYAGNDYINNYDYGSLTAIFGGDGADYISNYASNATIDGGNDNDDIYNAESASLTSIYSGDGDDSIGNLASNVTIEGGAGNDYLYNGCSLDDYDGTVYYYDDEDSYGSNSLFKYSLGDGNDVIYGFKANSTLSICGGEYSTQKSGDDVIITVGDEKISLIGAASLGTINVLGDKIVEDQTILVLDDSFASNITLSSNIETVDATARTKAIKIVGNALNNSIKSGTGKDTLVGSDGNDYLNGNSGSDSLSGGNGNDKLYGGSGNDILIGGNGNDSLNGYTGNDKLSGGDGADTLIGGAGNDSLVGGSGNDKLSGGDGKDTLFGSSGNDSLNGGAGNDKLSGGTGKDTLIGGKGADIFIFSAGNDVITDYVSGEDKISLGAAISNVSLSGNDAILIFSSNTLTIKDVKDKELTIIDSKGTELNTIIGSSLFETYDDSSASNITIGASVITVDATARTLPIKITANALNNSIKSGTGKDILLGKDGDDYLNGNSGSDSISGGNGNDKLYGGSGNDTLIGGSGNDSLNGYTGNDKLSGGDGNDTLLGGAGSDSLNGGAGDDTLWGGIGNDTLKGGTGADLFIYNSGEGKDIISDFANDDLLQITGDFTTSCNSSNIIFTVGNGSLTLKNYTATTFNINGDNYQISGSSLVKK